MRSITAQSTQTETGLSADPKFENLRKTFQYMTLDSQIAPQSRQRTRPLVQLSNQVRGEIHPASQDTDEATSTYHTWQGQGYDAQKGGNPANMTNTQWERFHKQYQSFFQRCVDAIGALNDSTASRAGAQMSQAYSILEGMWDNGIFPGLQLLQKGLPTSFDYLLQFWQTAYITYQSLDTMLSGLHLQVICLERLGYLAQYRASVDWETQGTCLSIASSFYGIAADQHQVAESNLLEELFHKIKALTNIQSPDARQDLFRLFRHVQYPTTINQYPVTLRFFIKAHSILQYRVNDLSLEAFINRFLTELEMHMSLVGSRFRQHGVFIMALNYAAISDYGCTQRVVIRTFKFAFDTLDLVLRRSTASLEDMMPMLYSSLVFLWSRVRVPGNTWLDLKGVPWPRIAEVLNMLLGLDDGEEFSMKRPASPQYLPEDYHIRGFPWSRRYYSLDYFNGMANGNEKVIEHLHETTLRVKRCLWLGKELARFSENSFQQFFYLRDRFYGTESVPWYL